MNCEDYEFLILQQKRGAVIEPDEAAALTRHLKECSSCAALFEIEGMLREDFAAASVPLAASAAEAQAGPAQGTGLGAAGSRAERDVELGRIGGSHVSGRTRGEDAAGEIPSPILPRVMGWLWAGDRRRSGSLRAAWSPALAVAIVLVLVWFGLEGRRRHREVQRQLDCLATQVGKAASSTDAALNLAQYVIDIQSRRGGAPGVSLASYAGKSSMLYLHLRDVVAITYLGAGQQNYVDGNKEGARKLFVRAVETGLDERLLVLTRFHLGCVLKELNRHGDAIVTYEEILNSLAGEPDSDPFVRQNRAMAWHYCGWGFYCLAEEEVRAGRHEVAKKRLDQALECYRRSLGILPDYHRVPYNEALAFLLLAHIAENEGENKVAEDYKRKATARLAKAEAGLSRRLREHPEDARARFSLSMVYVKMQDYDRAMTELEQAVEEGEFLAVLVPTEDVFEELKKRYPVRYEKIDKKRSSAEPVPSGNMFLDRSPYESREMPDSEG